MRSSGIPMDVLPASLKLLSSTLEQFESVCVVLRTLFIYAIPKMPIFFPTQLGTWDSARRGTTCVLSQEGDPRGFAA